MYRQTVLGLHHGVALLDAELRGLADVSLFDDTHYVGQRCLPAFTTDRPEGLRVHQATFLCQGGN